jgi:hypothetical protein
MRSIYTEITCTEVYLGEFGQIETRKCLARMMDIDYFQTERTWVRVHKCNCENQHKAHTIRRDPIDLYKISKFDVN